LKDIDIKENMDFENIYSFISTIFEKNQFDFISFLNKNVIKNDEFLKNYNPGLYILLSSYKYHNETLIIKYSYYLRNTYPNSFSILICDNKTTIEEINCFLHRVIYCNYKIPFFILGLSKLENINKTKLNEILNDFKQEYIKSYLFFIFYDSDEEKEIVKSSKLYKQMIKISYDDYEDLNITFDKVEILEGECSGIGKSFIIKNFAKDYNYINLPFGYEDNKLHIIQRLEQQNFLNTKCNILHINLYDNCNIEFINEFFFCLIFTKIFTNNEKIFVIPDNVKIIIEIPYSYINFYYKSNILKLIKNNQKIKSNKLPILNTGPELEKKINLICSYLYYMETNEIEQKDISLDNNEQISENSLKIKKFDPIDSYNYLLKSIKSPVTYYQLISYINILYEQLYKFSTSPYYLVESINNQKLRIKILEKLIEFSYICSRPGYKNLINGFNYKTINSNTIEDLRKEEKNTILNFFTINESQSKVNFNDLPDSICIFNHEENNFGGSISIISKGKIEDNIFKELLNLDVNNNGIDDFSQLKHFDFYNKIRIYFNKNINNKELNIPKGYVFTKDNYYKTILIDIKINTFQPIVLMGETGCGKTFLLTMISQVMDIQKEIINIHAGITENDIIKFMNEIEEKNKKMLEERKKKIEERKINTIKNKESNKELLNIQKEIQSLQKKYENNLKDLENTNLTPEEIDNLQNSQNDINIKIKNLKTKYEKLKENLNSMKIIDIPSDKFIIFFDEINTSTAIGLISEILCNRTCRGKPLPNNLVFVSACNPYKKKYKDSTNYGLVYKPLYINKYLVYNVLPLPYNLIY
jgi:energy-coupling factor transporter ATP-binding protein EcfA2